MIYPDKKQYEEYKKEYSVIPVIKEIEGDIDTPITLFKKLCENKVSFLLESVDGGNKWGRYSFIGRKPYITIKGENKKITITKDNKISKEYGKSLDIVRKLFKNYKMPNQKEYPDFLGGGVGYIAYDVIRDYEKLVQINEDDIELPDLHLLIMEEFIVYDHMKQKILIIINNFTEKDEISYTQSLDRIQEIEREIREVVVNFSFNNQYEHLSFKSNETKESFMRKVKTAKEYIRKGDIFQVVLSQRFTIDTTIEPLEFYRVLRSLNPSPYMYYLNYGEYQVVGSSPELLVKLKDKKIETCPIAGTRPRGKNEEDDDAYAVDLLEDEKEKAEHLMLLDLARNDIGKLSKFGSVEVTNFMEIQRYSHVMHIVSNVVGDLDDKHDMFDVIISCLPAGTVSGAPKVRAMEIIDELETTKRGLYAGSVGYFGFNGNMDMCITIRTVLLKEGKAYIQAGAGIVADSNPSLEYEETLKKAGALIDAVKKMGVIKDDTDY
ncbi:MAG: anthranilate synthase component I [Eubacteriaceae bacterium]